MNDTEAVLQAGKELAGQGARAIDVAGIPAIVRHNDYKVDFYPQYMDSPKRKCGTRCFDDSVSFGRFFNDHKTAASRIFVKVHTAHAKMKLAVIVGIINADAGKPESKPDFGDFRCQLDLDPSVEWRRWFGQDGVANDHEPFCDHLEKCKEFIIEPAGADLLQLISDLEGRKDCRFEKVVNLRNGRSKLVFDETVKLTGGAGESTKRSDLEVPAEITVALPLFDFGSAYKLKARLRYRVADKNLVFAYETIDPHLVIKDAIRDLILDIEKATETEVLLGTY